MLIHFHSPVSRSSPGFVYNQCHCTLKVLSNHPKHFLPNLLLICGPLVAMTLPSSVHPATVFGLIMAFKVISILYPLRHTAYRYFQHIMLSNYELYSTLFCQIGPPPTWMKFLPMCRSSTSWGAIPPQGCTFWHVPSIPMGLDKVMSFPSLAFACMHTESHTLVRRHPLFFECRSVSKHLNNSGCINLEIMASFLHCQSQVTVTHDLSFLACSLHCGYF